MRKFIIATIVAGGAVLGLGTGAQAAPAVSAIASHLDTVAATTSVTPALLGASPETLLEPVQYGPRGDWRRREEARRRAEWRRRHYRRAYRR